MANNNGREDEFEVEIAAGKSSSSHAQSSWPAVSSIRRRASSPSTRHFLTYASSIVGNHSRGNLFSTNRICEGWEEGESRTRA